VARTEVGTATLTFSSGNAALHLRRSDGIVHRAVEAIVRQVFRQPGTVCQ
jgi:hypothetical protein